MFQAPRRLRPRGPSGQRAASWLWVVLSCHAFERRPGEDMHSLGQGGPFRAIAMLRCHLRAQLLLLSLVRNGLRLSSSMSMARERLSASLSGGFGPTVGVWNCLPEELALKALASQRTWTEVR